MKVTKTCPKCKGTEILTNEGLLKRGDRSGAVISSWTGFSVAIYVCAKCGYFEEYVDEKDLNKEKFKAAMQKEWKRM